MTYIIQRTDQGGGMLAAPGTGRTWTNDLRKVRKFSSREQAQAECCPENEVPVPLSQYI